MRDHPEILRRTTKDHVEVKKVHVLQSQPEVRAVAVNQESVKLINRIEKQQGLLDERNSGHVNKTQFGEGGKPLVAFTARELQNVPGVKVEKYSIPKQQNKASPFTKSI